MKKARARSNSGRTEQGPKPTTKSAARALPAKPEKSARAKKKPAQKAKARRVEASPAKRAPRPATKPPAKKGKPIEPKAPALPAIRTRSEFPGPLAHADDTLVEAWAEKGAKLLELLASHGAEEHEYRVDLKDGRFVWVDPQGRVSAEARALAICSYTPATTSLTMAWADPLLRSASISRVDRIPSEHDDVDEEGAWRVAIAAANVAGAEYVYRVEAPNLWYFLALTALTFQPARPSFTPSTPVGFVLSELATCRQSLHTRAEPALVVRERLARIGSALLHEAEYAYRGTDWVTRLARTGKRLGQLARKVPVPSFNSVAQGAITSEWLAAELAPELDDALRMLEDEWRLFA